METDAVDQRSKYSWRSQYISVLFDVTLPKPKYSESKANIDANGNEKSMWLGQGNQKCERIQRTYCITTVWLVLTIHDLCFSAWMKESRFVFESHVWLMAKKLCLLLFGIAISNNRKDLPFCCGHGREAVDVGCESFDVVCLARSKTNESICWVVISASLCTYTT